MGKKSWLHISFQQSKTTKQWRAISSFSNGNKFWATAYQYNTWKAAEKSVMSHNGHITRMEVTIHRPKKKGEK